MTEGDVIGSYFLELWRLSAKAAASELEAEAEVAETDYCDELEEDEKLPTELDTQNSSGGFAVIGPDKLSIHYATANRHSYDVGAVQANRPAPLKLLVYYFEIFVKNAGAKGKIAIGFTPPGFNVRRQPGWEENSYGYHGDDGMLFNGNGRGEEFGPTYTTGDIVGGGINYVDHEIFFTKNGNIVGLGVPKDVKGPLFPTVAVHSQNEEVTVNFGQDPFAFDVKDFEVRLRAKTESKIEDVSIPQKASYGIVRSYLQHYGYEETLTSFDLASTCNVPSISVIPENNLTDENNIYALNHRRTLRQLIRRGDIDGALDKLQKWYPGIVQDEKSAICFLLHCQKFIELVRIAKLEESVAYGRIGFEKFYKSSKFGDLVKDCAALLAYEQLQNSSVGYLLQESQRELVADAVNAMILSTNPCVKDAETCLHSGLERLVKQLTACFLEKRSLSGGEGEAFHLHKILYSCGRG